MSAPNELVLRVRHLTASFRTDDGLVTAVDDVSLDVRRGETLGLVGESGAGKSVTAKAILRLLPERTSLLGPQTEILFEGLDLARADEETLCAMRGAKLAMVFQEPLSALNPVFPVGWQIEEALRCHTELDLKGRRTRALEWLRQVEIDDPKRRHREYPHELSGGMRQRVLIAMALCCEPAVLFADEPTSALDTTTAAQILALLQDLKAKLGTAIVLITHDLGAVAGNADRVCVLYAGRVIEEGPVRDIFRAPQHPYTRALLRSRFGAREARAVQRPSEARSAQHPSEMQSTARPTETRSASRCAARGRRLPAIEGAIPSLAELPTGCRFHPRCPIAEERCVREEPELGPHAFPERPVRCHFPLDPLRATDGALP